MKRGIKESIYAEELSGWSPENRTRVERQVSRSLWQTIGTLLDALDLILVWALILAFCLEAWTRVIFVLESFLK